MLACVLHYLLPVRRTDDVAVGKAAPYSTTCRPSRLLRSGCNAGAIVAQDRCPAFSMAEGGEVRLLVGSGASSERISAADEAADGPNGRLPVRDGGPRYVRRGQLWRRRASGEGLREACMRIGTADWVSAGAVMPREARQEALGRRYATERARSLFDSQNPRLFSEKVTFF